ncbi:hypothetical protein [Sphingomonas arantia]|uniref:hypothetical protein n=1 Tax=Sphingomonas arantia TaxID=1460676 RepID=UPI0036D29D11
MKTQKTALPFTMIGTVSALRMRSNEYVPSGSLRIASPGDASSVGFQVDAPSDDADALDVTLITKNGEDITETPEGKVAATGTIPFLFSVTKSGDVTIVVGEKVSRAKFTPGAEALLVATCTSGQFKFTGTLSNTVQSLIPDTR